MITVLIVDDHNLVRVALKMLLEKAGDINVVGEAENGMKAIDLVRTLKPDVVLIDLHMPGISGLETTLRLKQFYPDLKIIALTAHSEDPFPNSLFEAGAAGFLTKDTTEQELIKAVHHVYENNVYITPDVAERVAWNRANLIKSPYAELTEKETEVMLQMLNGRKIKDIAIDMNLSIKTVSNHKATLFKKLNVKSDVDLVQLAMAHGLLDDLKIKK